MLSWLVTRPGPGHVVLSLPSDGTTIKLITAEGIEFATMSYAKQKSGVSEGLRPDGSSRKVKFTKGATPGAPNIVPAYNGPRINEVLAFSRNATSDWVEFHNDTGSDMSLDGVSLSRRTNGAGDWIFPMGSTIKMGGYLVVRFDDSQPVGDLNTGFPLAAEGGGVYMFDPDGFLSRSIEYGFQVAVRSIGLRDGLWPPFTDPTPGKLYTEPVAMANPVHVDFNEWIAQSATRQDQFQLFNPET